MAYDLPLVLALKRLVRRHRAYRWPIPLGTARKPQMANHMYQLSPLRDLLENVSLSIHRPIVGRRWRKCKSKRHKQLDGDEEDPPAEPIYNPGNGTVSGTFSGRQTSLFSLPHRETLPCESQPVFYAWPGGRASPGEHGVYGRFAVSERCRGKPDFRRRDRRQPVPGRLSGRRGGARLRGVLCSGRMTA